jgi:hypothetical protein
MPNREHRSLRDARRSRPQPFAPIVALAILAAGIAYAQQNLPVPAAPAPGPANAGAAAGAAAPPPAAAPVDDAKDKDKGDATPPPAPAAGRGSPQHFEPTEKVRPDFDVAFPVDI